MKRKRTEIGTFYELSGNKYPKFTAFEMRPQDKAKVLHYLEEADHIAESPSMAVDVFTKERLSKAIALQADDKYIWRSDISYYFDKYNLKLPDEFINYVLKH